MLKKIFFPFWSWEYLNSNILHRLAKVIYILIMFFIFIGFWFYISTEIENKNHERKQKNQDNIASQWLPATSVDNQTLQPDDYSDIMQNLSDKEIKYLKLAKQNGVSMEDAFGVVRQKRSEVVWEEQNQSISKGWFFDYIYISYIIILLKSILWIYFISIFIQFLYFRWLLYIIYGNKDN